jgi:hypothetical protein
LPGAQGEGPLPKDVAAMEALAEQVASGPGLVH